MSPPDDDSPSTPLDGSGAYPVLQHGARELADKLATVPGDEAERLRAQLLAIAAMMRAWSPYNRPTEQERKALVDELVTATKAAMMLISRSQRSCPP